MHRNKRLIRIGRNTLTRSRASIRRDRSQWVLAPVLNGERTFLGVYRTPQEAGHAWHVAADLLSMNISPTIGSISDRLHQEL